jgi:hypothetical protein
VVRCAAPHGRAVDVQVIYDQAENRLHAQKALLTLAVNGFDWKP